MRLKLVIIGCVFWVLVSLSLWAAEKHGKHKPGMDHDSMVNSATEPQEGGHATFAALVEIVAMLENDDKTQWEDVNIDALHAHLLDMNNLILNTEATTSVLGTTQIRFKIRGTKASVPSIHRMVPAHSRFIQQSRGWIINPELDDTGATITITVEDIKLLDRLSALGFYGFMSLDSHHQAHHYQMATGNSH